MNKLTAAIALVLCAFSVAHAADAGPYNPNIFISPIGSDGNIGTAECPFRTMARAISEIGNAVPWSIVYRDWPKVGDVYALASIAHIYESLKEEAPDPFNGPAKFDEPPTNGCGEKGAPIS